MDTEINTEKMLNYAKNIVLSLSAVFIYIFIIPIIGMLLFLKIADPVAFNAILMLSAVVPVDSLSTQLASVIVTVLPSVAFIIWIIRDSRKFVALGVKTRPALWGIGMILPLIFIVLPLYFIRRNITWSKEKEEISLIISKNKNGLSAWWENTDLLNEKTKIIIKKVWNVLKWVVVVLVWLFVLLTFVGIPGVLEKQKTDEQVEKIHATKLTMDDVMGVNLPPDPGAEADKTVPGVDANTNGIRDDVELAIFKEYPNSAKTRAVLLQYALALQMEVVQPFENTKNVTEVVREEDRASSCVADELVPRDSPGSMRTYADVEKIFSYTNFVEDSQFNTQERKTARKNFLEKMGSFASMNKVCDIDYSILPN